MTYNINKLHINTVILTKWNQAAFSHNYACLCQTATTFNLCTFPSLIFWSFVNHARICVACGFSFVDVRRCLSTVSANFKWFRIWPKVWSVEIYALFVFYVGDMQSLRKSYHVFFLRCIRKYSLCTHISCYNCVIDAQITDELQVEIVKFAYDWRMIHQFWSIMIL